MPYLDGRIVGGLVTTINKIPWQVSLQLRGQHFCGGSIVARQWIATAAHCTKFVSTALCFSLVDSVRFSIDFFSSFFL